MRENFEVSSGRTENWLRNICVLSGFLLSCALTHSILGWGWGWDVYMTGFTEPYHMMTSSIFWKKIPRYWPFVRGIHRSPVNSPHKGQWRGALMFSLICAWINSWVNNREAGDLRHHLAHYDVSVIIGSSNGLSVVQHQTITWTSFKP